MIKKFYGTCEHGQTHPYEIQLPLTAEVLDCAELDDDPPEFIVWLKAGEMHHVTTITRVTDCVEQAEFVAAAANAFLATPEGQKQALEYIKHDLDLKEVE